MGMRTRIFLLQVAALLCLFVACIAVGSVSISPVEMVRALCAPSADTAASRYILLSLRLPAAVTALVSGAALSASGLLLQTVFRNGLAGPDVLGVSSGAAAGVAVLTLLAGYAALPQWSVCAAAFAGAMAVTAVIWLLSTLIHQSSMLLIAGIMVGYLSSSVVALLTFVSTGEGVKSYMLWGMGDFTGVTPDALPGYVALLGLPLLASLLTVKPLTTLLAGESYAASMGMRVRRVRTLLLLLTGLLTAITTAHCGPISFIGLAVPHISRLLMRTDLPRLLLPSTLVMGGVVALGCSLLCQTAGSFLPTPQVLPLGAVTPLVGAPVIIYVLVSGRMGDR